MWHPEQLGIEKEEMSIANNLVKESLKVLV